MSKPETLVLKLGGSVLSSEDQLPDLVHEIYRRRRAGYRVVAVASALGGTTESLIARGAAFPAARDESFRAALLATGELASASLLGLALERAGIPAALCTPQQIGLTTSGPTLDADPVALDRAAVEERLDAGQVVVVPGYSGHDRRHGRPTLLGRGGSDLTAVFLAQRLGADCELLKDVDGIFERGPSSGDPGQAFDRLSWADAVDACGPAIQPKALRYARRHRVPLTVSRPGGIASTRIGDAPTRRRVTRPGVRPLRIGLLGLGTVGQGVYRHLTRHPEQFELVGAAVRDLAKPRQHAPDPRDLTVEAWRIVSSDCDVIVELTDGNPDSTSLIEAALREGKSVITANKEISAVRGARYRRLAARHGGRFVCSASVAGAIPALEWARRLASRSVRSIEGVLNGTTNFILGRLEQGASFAEALNAAQTAGFAEADPGADLSGRDAACKIALLAEAAFGESPSLDAIRRDELSATTEVPEGNQRVRFVARAWRRSGRIQAEVVRRVLPATHPLASVEDEDNAVIFELADGTRHALGGKGAGRWPTAESVFADLLQLSRAHQRRSAGRRKEKAS
ncbi:hypothetical protein ABI59_22665 [Acidobacteria bacterium Mor1]|nr:hypothetical protein ABI59_22665 [Acidobacteria bacterium Mor1]